MLSCQPLSQTVVHEQIPPFASVNSSSSFGRRLTPLSEGSEILKLAQKLNEVLAAGLRYNIPTLNLSYNEFPIMTPPNEFLVMLKECPPFCGEGKIRLHLILSEVERWPGFTSEALAFFLEKVTNLSLVRPNFRRLADLEFRGPNDQVTPFNSIVLKRIFPHFEAFFGELEKGLGERSPKIIYIPNQHEYNSLVGLCHYALTLPSFALWSKNFPLEELLQLYENVKIWEVDELAVKLKEAISQKIRRSNAQDFDFMCHCLNKKEFYKDVIEMVKETNEKKSSKDILPPYNPHSLKKLALNALKIQFQLQ